ncbi:epidermal growth factor-like protein 7 isoform X2 [Tachypleus tridentatus]|uniref:epidermal growth factor-like protein 7 isoform X2 n=1 Tax=Tachypleus tridentatus TaxID=6853 RepID=UPI003FD4E3AB
MAKSEKWCIKGLLLFAASFILISVVPLQSSARTNSLVSYREALEKTREVHKSLAARNSHTNSRFFERHRHHGVAYETSYRSVYKTTSHTETVYQCCPGWTRSSSHARDCMKAICSPQCKNGGICTKPNYCYCKPGWTGYACETDIDECLKKNEMCTQSCVNTPGSYSCGCHKGFTLQNDGKSCKISLHNDPEYHRFVLGYEELNQRVVVLEKIQEKHNLTDLELRVKTMAEAMSLMSEEIVSTTRFSSGDDNKGINYPHYGSPWERVHSLSLQISMLEERLEDCTCNQHQRRARQRPRL